jgi:hypothetical protein
VLRNRLQRAKTRTLAELEGPVLRKLRIVGRLGMGGREFENTIRGRECMEVRGPTNVPVSNINSHGQVRSPVLTTFAGDREFGWPWVGAGSSDLSADNSVNYTDN